MALDGKILAKAKSILAERRRLKDERLGQRISKAYDASSRISEIDAELRATMAHLVGVALGVDGAAGLDDIRDRNLALQQQRRNELKQAGFPENYLDDDYLCSKCHDTGFIDSKMCDCLADIYKDEQKASLSCLFKLGDETFDSFNLSYYDDTPAPDTGISPRRSMEIVNKICVEYAKNFSKGSMNLFFNGAPGLGKTFLSACIARVVADNGYSVVYDMATTVFTKHEEVKFTRTNDSEDLRAEIKKARDDVKRYLECDLLIIDDLGTEMTTSFTISALYEIINTRLITGRKTLISSNLTLAELRRRYSEQIMSRLEGEYQVLTFYGEDIRKKRNVL